MKLPIDSIVVGCRYRKNFGDIASLAQSMREVGQLAAIVVDANHRLLAGERRLKAAQMLGWTVVDALVYDGDASGLIVERDENSARKPFETDELIELASAIEEEERRKAKERQGARTDLNRDIVQTVAQSCGEKSRDIAAAKIGLSGESLRVGKKVLRTIRDLKERDDCRGEILRRTMNGKGIKAAAKQADEMFRPVDREPEHPEKSDDAWTRETIARVLGMAAELDNAMTYSHPDCLPDHHWEFCVRFADWILQRKRKPLLRVVEP